MSEYKSIWDEVDECEQEEIDEEKNPFLTDYVKGMGLISQLLPNQHQWSESERIAHNLDRMLDYQTVKILDGIDEVDILAIGEQLERISDKITEYHKIRLLSGKTVIGIGGRFSAGKSCFINSLLKTQDGEILLPEDQNPTTSIPTYIVKGENEEIHAYTADGRIVSLSRNAMQALTHDFYDYYQIGFSKFVKNLVVNYPRFPRQLSKKVALLDTPGYNKPDVDTRESLTDNFLATEQLKTVDFLIWLIDIDNGTISESDLNFIANLNLKNPILIVLNKSDKKTPAERKDIFETVTEALKGITVYGVAVYSSRDGVEYLDKKLIESFLNEAVEYADRKDSINVEVLKISEDINSVFNQAIEDNIYYQEKLGHDIFRTDDIMSITSLSELYKQVLSDTRTLREGQIKFNRIIHDILINLRMLTDRK